MMPGNFQAWDRVVLTVKLYSIALKQPHIPHFTPSYNKAEAPIFWPPDAKSQLTGKDSDAGKD